MSPSNGRNSDDVDRESPPSTNQRTSGWGSALATQFNNIFDPHLAVSTALRTA